MIPSVSRTLAPCAVILLCAPGALRADERREEPLGSGSFETRVVVRAAEAPGPTVVITGGLHGDEPAGACAAAQVAHWPIRRGRLVILARANPPALERGTRRTPGAAKDLADLNRNFPRAGFREGARGEPAQSIWALVSRLRPDWLIDLHEGYDFNAENDDSVGSTVIAALTSESLAVAALLVAAVNSSCVTRESRRFALRRPPVDGSLARAASEHLGAHALIAETTTKGQTLARRARQHRVMVHALLASLEMLEDAVTPEWMSARGAGGPRALAVFDAQGVEGPGLPNVVRQLAGEAEVVRIHDQDVRAGALAGFAAVLFTGGSGSAQGRALGSEGRSAVRRFVEDGGGFVGICAGAFLASEGQDWSLGLIDAHTAPGEWRRGRGAVRVELTATGRDVLGGPRGELLLHYSNGPVLLPSNRSDLPDFETLAVFRSEHAENGAQEGLMLGAPAVLRAGLGRGRVVCFSPHPEQSEGLEDLLVRAVRWAAGGEKPR